MHLQVMPGPGSDFTDANLGTAGYCVTPEALFNYKIHQLLQRTSTLYR